MTTQQRLYAGIGALAVTFGLASTALAKPDYLDRMNPRPIRPAAQHVAQCDCPMMHTGGPNAGSCMAPPVQPKG